MTLFIEPKPKGGKGQVLQTCWLSLDHEQSRRSFDSRQRRRGWRRESLCFSPPVPGPAALQARRGSAAPPLPPPTAGTGRRRRRRRRRECHCNGRRGAAGAASATATGGDAGGVGGQLPAPRRTAPPMPPHPGPARPAAPHQAAEVVMVEAAAAVAGAVVAAPTPARPTPGSLIAPQGLARRRGQRSQWRKQRVISICVRSISICIYILISRRRIGAEHRRIQTQISCFSPSVMLPPGISKHTDAFGSIFNFESSTRSDPGYEFRIECRCMQARSISAL